MRCGTELACLSIKGEPNSYFCRVKDDILASECREREREREREKEREREERGERHSFN
jgi:hypothetical protein